jgi:DNA-binding CsgD family transcriptional regulator
MIHPPDYSIFYQFIKKFQPSGFENPDRSDELILSMERKMQKHRQFFFVGDLIQLRIKFTSNGSRELLGIDPENIDPATFYTLTHPDDLIRHNVGRTKLFNLGQELFITKRQSQLLSSYFRFLHRNGNYNTLLVQCFLFYTEIPYRTVFLLQVVTDISRMKLTGHGYHFYVGEDLSFFRYPDSQLLKTGNVFSHREFEIIQLISKGFDSLQISEKLFISLHTVNTHRRNIIKKTGHSNTQKLIIDLKERGII